VYKGSSLSTPSPTLSFCVLIIIILTGRVTSLEKCLLNPFFNWVVYVLFSFDFAIDLWEENEKLGKSLKDLESGPCHLQRKSCLRQKGQEVQYSRQEPAWGDGEGKEARPHEPAS
jgi:hypothetical protein